jgi:type IV pilus assembly protein PilB
MIDMGIEPFLVASSTNLIQAQRLIRRLCENCKKKEEIHPEVMRELGIPDEMPFEIYSPIGCPKCSNTGYKGRTGLYEVMPITSEIREMILNRCSSIEICEQAVKEGMLTLRADGVEKLKAGWTSVDEVLRETTNQ